MTRALLFDFDGVIADTEPLHFEMFQRVLHEDGVSLTWREYSKKYLGLNDEGCFHAVLRDHRLRVSSHKIRTLVRKKSRLMKIRIARGIRFYPGVKRLIPRLASKYRLAIVSGALKSEILQILEQGHLRAHFKVVVGAEEVAHGKPHPAGFKLGQQRLNRLYGRTRPICPTECLVIEDSPWGLEAARRARMSCVALAHSYPKKALRNADFVLSDFADLAFLLTSRSK